MSHIDTLDALRHSGIYSIGTNKWTKSEVGSPLGSSLQIEPSEVWGLKSIEGSIKNSSQADIHYELQLVSCCDIDLGNNNKRVVSTLLYTKIIKVKSRSAKNFKFSSKEFLGRIMGPFEESQKLFLTTDSKSLASIYVTANFERMSPSPLWKKDSAPVIIQGGSGVPQDGMTDRYERDIYFIPDPDAEEFEDEALVPPGYHQTRDGKWHACPKCLELIHHGDESGGLEFLQGGTAKVEVKNIKDIEEIKQDNDVQIKEDVEVESAQYEGGEKADPKKLEELKVGAKNRPGNVTCNACGASSEHEKYPPICKKNCPKMFINDVMASSWHKGPDGKYHYCETCVELVLEANDMGENSETS